MKPDFSEKSRFKTAPKTTVKLTDLLKVEKKDSSTTTDNQVVPDEPFTPEQLQKAWNEFAEARKKFQAEYHLLTQPYALDGTAVTLHIHNPVQDLMLNNMRLELSAFLRDRLKNNSVTLTGVFVEQEARKVIYTNREKFDYLLERNPVLRELKDRLGLDTDF
jgi:DNA polymerase-3 subunit gamma/tau